MMRIRRALGHHWTLADLAMALLLVGAGLAATWDAWVDIFRIALRDEEASHIFLVPIVTIWMAAVRRARWRQCRPVHRWIGPVVVALGALVSWIGYTQGQGIQALWHLGSLLIVVGCFLSVAGLMVLRRFLPVFAVLLFMIPVPGSVRMQIAIPLQTATAIVSAFLLDAAGVDVVRSGNALEVNGQAATIAEACNGMRMVFALLMVSYAFAFGAALRQYVRVTILLASPLLAILCNVVRILPTVLVYGEFSKEFGDFFHTAAGWVMLLVAFVLLMGLVRVLRWALLPITPYPLAQQ